MKVVKLHSNHPKPPESPPVLVMGGLSDFTVDEKALRDTAEHWGVEPCLLPDTAHDIMLLNLC